jgi:OOP family OmpA-OmpF porin
MGDALQGLVSFCIMPAAVPKGYGTTYIGIAMKKNLLIALIAAAAIAPVAAQAQTYIGVNAGRAQQKLTLDGVPTQKDTTTTYQVYGGYQITPMFGVEGGYADLGEASLSGNGAFLSASPAATYLAGTFTYALPSNFALIGKLGVARTNTDIITSIDSIPVQRHNSLLVGIGATYAITPAILAVVEYQNFGKVIDEDGGKLKAQALTVGVRMKF